MQRKEQPPPPWYGEDGRVDGASADRTLGTHGPEMRAVRSSNPLFPFLKERQPVDKGPGAPWSDGEMRLRTRCVSLSKQRSRRGLWVPLRKEIHPQTLSRWTQVALSLGRPFRRTRRASGGGATIHPTSSPRRWAGEHGRHEPRYHPGPRRAGGWPPAPGRSQTSCKSGACATTRCTVTAEQRPTCA